MKKISFILLMMFVPFMGYSTSVTMVRQKWAEKSLLSRLEIIGPEKARI